LAYNLVILSGGEVITRALTFVAFVYLARVLEPNLFGLVELTLAVTMIINLGVEQGLGTYGTREVARHPEKIEPLVSRILSAQVVLSIIAYAILALATLCLSLERTLTLLLLGYGLSVFGTPFLLRWVFQGRNQMVWVATPQVLRYAIFLFAVLVFIKSPEQILVLPVAEIAAVYTAALICVIIFKRSGERLPVKLRSAFDRSLFAESLPIGASEIIWVLRMYLPIIIIGILATKAEVGLFGAAHRIMMVFQAMLGVYFLNIFPTMSQASFESKGHLSKLLHGSLPLAIWPSLVLALTISLAGATVIRLIFGDNYAQPGGVGTLVVLIWLIPILAWRRHGRSALITINRQKEELLCSLIGLTLLVLFLIPLVFAYGPVGSAWAIVASELAASVLIWWRLKRYVPNLNLIKPLLFVPLVKCTPERSS